MAVMSAADLPPVILVTPETNAESWGVPQSGQRSTTDLVRELAEYFLSRETGEDRGLYDRWLRSGGPFSPDPLLRDFKHWKTLPLARG